MQRKFYIHKTALRKAFEDAGYVCTNNAGIEERSGWSVDRAAKKKRRRRRRG